MQFKLDKKTYQNKLKSFKNKDSIKFHQHLVDLLEIKKSDKVLDLGCGHGHTLLYIAQKLGKTGKAIGLDIEERLLAVAERVLKNEIFEGKLELIKSDVSNKLPFPNNSFDKIVCHNVIECIPDRINFINECYRILKKDGILVMSHNDFDTQTYNSSFPDLSRRLVHNYCDTEQEWMETSDGMIGRKLSGLFHKTKFKRTEALTYVTTNTEFKPLEYGYSSAHNIVDIAKKSKKFKPTELKKWLEDLGEKDKSGEYFYSVNIYIIVARK